MNLGSETQLRVGWVGTAFWIALAMLVVAGDWVLYFIFWNLPLLLLGVFLTLGSLTAIAFLMGRSQLKPRQIETDEEKYRRLV